MSGDQVMQLLENYLQSADGIGDGADHKRALLRFADWLEEEEFINWEKFVPVKRSELP